jgi:hypothetical protein
MCTKSLPQRSSRRTVNVAVAPPNQGMKMGSDLNIQPLRRSLFVSGYQPTRTKFVVLIVFRDVWIGKRSMWIAFPLR